MPSGARELEVISLCCYLTSIDGDWREVDYTASKMVKALKGDDIKGYFKRKSGTYDNSNKHLFVKRIPKAMCAHLLNQLNGRAAIVPIPNSTVCSPNDANFKTLELAKDISSGSNGRFSAIPLLTFRRPQEKTRSGGTRDPSLIEAEYVVRGTTDLPIILVDDVLTSGGHLIAACRVLEKRVSLPVGAMTFGLSVKDQRPNPIDRHTTQLAIDPMRFV